MAACAYCKVRPGHTRDHVIPQSWRKRWRKEREWMKRHLSAKGYQALVEIPEELLATVPCCLECNLVRGTRKFVPASWEHHIPLLKELIPGPWRVWHGTRKEEAYRGTHV